MADITLTAASVVAGAGAQVAYVTAGEAITRGVAVYLNPTDSEYYIADCTDEDKDDVAGFALTTGANGGPLKILKAGSLTCGSDLAAGQVYFLAESGHVMPHSDLATDDYVTYLGVATAATALQVDIAASAVQYP